MEHHTGCLICGKDLVHHDTGQTFRCALCKKEEVSYFSCPDEHFVCNQCHSKKGIVAVLRHCWESKEIHPAVLAEQMMEDPAIAMHGPDHHFLVGAALLTAIRNGTGQVTWEDIEEVVRRGSAIPGGFCGLYGACGAGISVGVAASVLTKATPVKAYERALANRVTAAALQAIADMGGVRCCKASTRIALEKALEVLDAELGLAFPPLEKTPCNYPQKNRQCNGLSCPYYQG